MGGIAGTQGYNPIRGMAIGRIGPGNDMLSQSEAVIGAANGVLWSSIVGTAAFLWFGDFTLGYVIALAITVNLVVAALIGSLLPGYLKMREIDPALAGGVILTTVTDVVGFFCF